MSFGVHAPPSLTTWGERIWTAVWVLTLPVWLPIVLIALAGIAIEFAISEIRGTSVTLPAGGEG